MTKRCVWVAMLGAAALAAGGCGPKWEPLFDGKTLAGWKSVGHAVWKVEDGAIVGTQDAQRRPGDLVTEREFADFDLEFTFKAVWPCNSGVWFRFNDDKGYQFDILEWPDPVAYTGTLYCPGKLFLAKNLDKSLYKVDGWNHGTISAIGDHVVMTLNGKTTADVHDATFTRGRIGFQVHPGDPFKDMKIFIKEIKIRVYEPAK